MSFERMGPRRPPTHRSDIIVSRQLDTRQPVAPGAVRSRSGDAVLMIRPHSNGETTCRKRKAPRRWQAATGRKLIDRTG